MKVRINDLEFENSALKIKSDKFRKEIFSEVSMNIECASKNYDNFFQKFLTKNIDKSKISSMIYGISGKGKRGIGYYKPKKSLLKPKPKNKVKKPRAMHYHLIYGHSYHLYFAHKPWFDQTYGKTNSIGPKKMWVPKDKIIYVADTLNSIDEISIMVLGNWMLSTHKGNNA